ncbi:MAG: hypothetical protein ABTD50_11575, partial [Polyangiaceae bacterium]
FLRYPDDFLRYPDDFLRYPDDFLRYPDDFLRYPDDFLRYPCSVGIGLDLGVRPCDEGGHLVLEVGRLHAVGFA